MEKPRVYLVFDRRKEVARKGVGKIEIIVSFNRYQRKYIIIGACKPEEYEKVIRKKVVADEVKKAQDVVDEMIELDEPLTVENFNFHADMPGGEHLTAEERKAKERKGSFPEYMRACILKEKLSDSTRKRKLRVVSAVEKAGFFKTFNDLIVPNIYKFEEFLQKPYEMKRGKNVQVITRDQATVFNYHKVVHQYATRAWRFGIIDVDPYNLVKLDHGTYGERTPLTEEEVKRICDLEGLNYQMTMCRDLFIFACHTGLAYIDTQEFNYEESVVKHNGMYFIDRHRVKTGVRYYTPILQPAMDVLIRYNNKLPRISNQKLNGYLKIIGEMAEIKKNITFHVARHTFATIALAHDIPMENVSRMLGHTNTRTTAIYAKILDETIARHAEELSDELLDMTPSELSEEDSKTIEQIYGKYVDTDTEEEDTEKNQEPLYSADPSQPAPNHKKRRRRHKRHAAPEANGVQCDTQNSNKCDTPDTEKPTDCNEGATSFGFNITGYYTMW